MTVSQNDGQLRVVLSEAETVKYNIDEVFFREGSKAADRALKNLLQLAAAEVKFSVGAARFQIEIYPVFDGGCEIFFIPDSAPKLRLRAVAKQPSDCFSAEFDDSDSMLSAVESLYLAGVHKSTTSSLYELCGKYRLFIWGHLRRDAEAILSEYCSKLLLSAFERVFTAEHGKMLSDSNAIESVGKVLAENIKAP